MKKKTVEATLIMLKGNFGVPIVFYHTYYVNDRFCILRVLKFYYKGV